MRHGTRYAYQTGCRCDECREWNRARQRAYRARRAERDDTTAGDD